MSSKTNKKAYQRHVYSGTIKHRKRMLAAFKRYHGVTVTSRATVWRKPNASQNSPINENIGHEKSKSHDSSVIRTHALQWPKIKMESVMYAHSTSTAEPKTGPVQIEYQPVKTEPQPVEINWPRPIPEQNKYMSDIFEIKLENLKTENESEEFDDDQFDWTRPVHEAFEKPEEMLDVKIEIDDLSFPSFSDPLSKPLSHDTLDLGSPVLRCCIKDERKCPKIKMESVYAPSTSTAEPETGPQPVGIKHHTVKTEPQQVEIDWPRTILEEKQNMSDIFEIKMENLKNEIDPEEYDDQSNWTQPLHDPLGKPEEMLDEKVDINNKPFFSLDSDPLSQPLEEKHKELKKELKRKRNCERQRAYYQRQKYLKKNEEKKKKVPKTNAERQREFRQRKAEKSYVDM